jgi:hypothetical protein
MLNVRCCADAVDATDMTPAVNAQRIAMRNALVLVRIEISPVVIF